MSRSNIQLYNDDCLPAMREMADNAFDLAIVDPPYGIGAGMMTMGKGSGNDTGRHKRKNWDNETPSDEYFNELRRVSKNQIIWGGNYFNLPPTRCYLLWDKKDYNSDFASHEMAWTSFDKVVKCFIRARSAGGDSNNKIHPTQKPKQLYKWLLTNYAKDIDCKECDNGRVIDDDGDGSTIPCEYCNGTLKRKQKILDTHLGSGSIALACWDLKFDLTGYEIDREYFDAAVKRLENHKAQTQLF